MLRVLVNHAAKLGPLSLEEMESFRIGHEPRRRLPTHSIKINIKAIIKALAILVSELPLTMSIHSMICILLGQ